MQRHRLLRSAVVLLALVARSVSAAPPWPLGEHEGTLESRLAPPEGFARVAVPANSFGAWLRTLPLRPGRPAVHLYDGSLKGNQEAHFAVAAVDVGATDLQQCADAVIRMRAEYLRASSRETDLCFRFTSGDPVPWTRWKNGEHPFVDKHVTWVSSTPDDSYASFRRWLDMVFLYAGTKSLARDLKAVPLAQLQPGDVFVQGGSPGHAVLVLDVAQGRDGRRVMLLGQSYMPAQEFQILRNPADPRTPWISVTGEGTLVTPEWVFQWSHLRRFPENACTR